MTIYLIVWVNTDIRGWKHSISLNVISEYDPELYDLVMEIYGKYYWKWHKTGTV